MGEDNVPLTVVFEILSPGNTVMEMDDKLAFYEEYGVEEYYVYDPDSNRLKVFLHRGEVLRRVRRLDGFVSPRLKIRFDLSGPELVIYHPDGEKFLTFKESANVRTERSGRPSKPSGRPSKPSGRLPSAAAGPRSPAAGRRGAAAG